VDVLGRTHASTVSRVTSRLVESGTSTRSLTPSKDSAARTGQIRGFVHSYLGMPDHRLPVPVADLVPCERVRTYGTNFKAMKPDDLEAIATRGEQLTRTLIAHYCPQL
jgi:hypothetical protein